MPRLIQRDIIIKNIHTFNPSPKKERKIPLTEKIVINTSSADHLIISDPFIFWNVKTKIVINKKTVSTWEINP